MCYDSLWGDADAGARPPKVVCDDNRIRQTRAADVFSDPNTYLLIFERKERAAAK